MRGFCYFVQATGADRGWHVDVNPLEIATVSSGSRPTALRLRDGQVIYVEGSSSEIETKITQALSERVADGLVT